MSTLDYEMERADKLAEIGPQLRRVREEKSISIEQIAATTLIQPRILKAIEAGKLEHLPEPIYVQGFIRRFADALGLDGTELASTFPTQQASQPGRPIWRELPTAQLRPLHLYLLYIVLVVAAVSGLSYFINRSIMRRETTPAADVQPPAPARAKVARNQSKVPSQPPASPAPTARSTKNPPAAPNKSTLPTSSLGKRPVRVGVTLKTESWVQVKVDGKTEFEGLLPPGTRRSWTADQKVVVRAGNAGGVLASVDDAPAKPLGATGAVETVTFEAKPNPAVSPSPPLPLPAPR